VCDLETSRMGAPYIYDISRLRVKRDNEFSGSSNPVNLLSEEILAAMKSLYSMDLVS